MIFTDIVAYTIAAQRDDAAASQLAWDVLDQLSYELADAFTADDPRFNRRLFLDIAGVEDH